MPEERTPTPVEEDGQVDHAIVLLLLDRESQRPWSEEEIKREIGCDVWSTIDPTSPPHCAGFTATSFGAYLGDSGLAELSRSLARSAAYRGTPAFARATRFGFGARRARMDFGYGRAQTLWVSLVLECGERRDENSSSACSRDVSRLGFGCGRRAVVTG